MNAHAVLLGFLLYMVTVNARHFADEIDTESDKGNQDTGRRAREGLSRHRRRSWQNYGYDYQQPGPYYQDNRRDYDKNQQDLMPQILRLLDEISSYVKRPALPPPPPQPIYVPYPVPYPVPQYCNCPAPTATVSAGTVPTAPAPTEVKPGVFSRLPEMEDTNQNWGFADEKQPDEADESDGSRPISFVPIVPKRPLKRLQPEVEHGSNQAGMATTQAPSQKSGRESTAPKLPGTCDIFALSCCSGTAAQQRQCFNNVGCGNTYNGSTCRQERVLSIIDAYSKAYSPVNAN